MTKIKSTKRALLFSALSLLLCISMLIGSTYAWFTDSVVSGSNIIKSGNLEVTMAWADGTKAVPAADSSEWTDASLGAIFNYDLWEPGYTEVRHIKIGNEGTLALKYIVNIRANGEATKLAEVIDVYFIDPAVQVTDRAEVASSYKVGTLADVLAGKAGAARGELLAGEIGYVTIALKMQETAGNEYQNLSIGSSFSVQLLATQLANESDSFGNQYDADAATIVEYDAAKTAVENGKALQAAINAASEGDIIVASAGTYQFAGALTINQDNITLVGENGAALENAAADHNGFLKVYGDNVAIRGLELNKNLTQTNQVILGIGAENLTVDSCTIYGENTGNTPTMGIYVFENLDSKSDEQNDEVTAFTITNNTFMGAAIGTYKGGAAKVTTDPGVITAQVSEKMLIKGNTFIGANILIESWRSWRTENTRDHELVPTIEGNDFVSPNLCFDNTPHSIYLRVYRQGDPEKVLPAGYIDAFIANNNVATPSNDTVVTYEGTSYVLNDTYECFFRTNATYGNIAYCYGQSFVEAN